MNYSQPVVTPEGTPLGGSVDLVVDEGGAYTVNFKMHSSSNFGSFDFRLVATLTAPGCPTFAFVHGGHVSGVNSNEHKESGHNDLIPLYWDRIQARGKDAFQVEKDYHWGGVVGSFNDVVKEVVTLGGGALGATLGVVIGATREATDWMDLDLGPGSTLGVIGGLVVFEVGLVAGLGSASSFIAGTVAGVATGAVIKEMIESRPLNEPEKVLARRVFLKTIDLDRVRITNLEGLGGAAFTAPGVDGKIYCNLGSAFFDPLGFTKENYPTAGQLLIHELVHAWQISYNNSWPALMCSGILNQTKKAVFSDNVYAYGDAGAPWSEFNLEQQGAIVDQWFGGSGRSANQRPMSRFSPYYRYVVDNLRFGQPVPDVSVAAIHPRTAEGATSLFAIDKDGRVSTNFWPDEKGAWSGWYALGDAIFPAGAPVTAIHPRTDEGATSLFAIGKDGRVSTNFWPDENGAWSGWHPLGAAIFPAGAPVTAIHPRTDEGATSLFATSLDGKVWTNFWPDEKGAWSGWHPLGAAIFPAGAPVTAIHPRTDEGATSLFAIGLDGKIWTNTWPVAQKPRAEGRMGEVPGAQARLGWSDWHQLGPEPFPVGAAVTAIHPRTDEGATTLFAIGMNGRVYSQFWPKSGGSDWSGWDSLGEETFPVGAPVTAIHPRTDEGATALFVIGNDRKVWTNFWPAPQKPRTEGRMGELPGHEVRMGWSGWRQIGDAGFPRWATATALHPRSDEGAVSVFAIGGDGRVWTTFWPDATGESGWAPWHTLGDGMFPT